MDRFEHARLARVKIGAGRDPQSTLNPRTEITDDVPEHVVGHNHIEIARVAHHLRAKRVHVHVLSLDSGILGRHLLERALPQASRISHGIRLIAQHYARARATVCFLVRLAVFKRIPDDPFNTLASIYILLDGDLLGSSLLEDSTGID